MNEADAEQVDQVSVHTVHTHTATAEDDDQLLAVAPRHVNNTALRPLDGAQQQSRSRKYLENGVCSLCS
jgi:hypothetical protein